MKIKNNISVQKIIFVSVLKMFKIYHINSNLNGVIFPLYSCFISRESFTNDYFYISLTKALEVINNTQ
jgi:hypothetical protein